MKRRNAFQISLRLIRLVRPLTGLMVMAVVLGWAGHLCATLITVLGAAGVLQTLTSSAFSFSTLAFLLVMLAIGRAVLRYGEQYCNHAIAFRLLALIRHQVFAALRRLCPAKLEGRNKGNLIALITADTELLEVFYAHTISPILIAAAMTLTVTVFLAQFHWSLGLLALIADLTLGIGVPCWIYRQSQDSGMQIRSQSGILSTAVLDTLRGMDEILQFDCGHRQMETIRRHSEVLSLQQQRLSRMSARSTALTNTLILLFGFLMLGLGGMLIQQGQIGPQGLVLSVTTLMSSFGPVSALAALGSTLQNTFAAASRILDLLDETPVVEEVSGQPDISFNGAEIRHLSFQYDDQPVLRDLSLSLPRKRIVGLCGRSGSGKSTLLQLLMRFWQSQQGEIRISDTPIDQINTANLRRMESLVSQSTHLFHDSIANNLRIANLNATDQQLHQACRKASIHDFIMSLPQGYDTPVAELGESLSGGERQRLGLARAFLHDADLMLLDEPTANLDSLNEAVILKSLMEETDSRTVVLVSHRLSTLRIADQILQVEQGRIRDGYSG